MFIVLLGPGANASRLHRLVHVIKPLDTLVTWY
jgi:hypothetical protein